MSNAKPGIAISINSLYECSMALVDFRELKAKLIRDGR